MISFYGINQLFSSKIHSSYFSSKILCQRARCATFTGATLGCFFGSFFDAQKVYFCQRRLFSVLFVPNRSISTKSHNLRKVNGCLSLSLLLQDPVVVIIKYVYQKFVSIHVISIDISSSSHSMKLFTSFVTISSLVPPFILSLSCQ